MRVLVTDGAERAALAVVRSLGAAGFEVCVCAAAKRSLAGASKWCRQELVITDPRADRSRFAEQLADAVQSGRIDVLVPISDASLLAVLQAPQRFQGIVVPFPPYEQCERVGNKALVAAVAAEVGIAIPAQVVVSDSQQAGGPWADTLRFPVVLKPSRSTVALDRGYGKFAVSYASSREELSRVMYMLPAAAFPLLVQERIVGEGRGVFLLTWHGRVLAVFAHRRLREKPPAGGVSVCREAVAADAALVSRSADLLQRLQWNGVAMVEYKIQSGTNVPYLMEINGRFWGSLQLAIDAGVDFPVLLLDAVAGRPPRSALGYRVGVRSRWFWGDVDHLIARLRWSDQALGLPPGAPQRLRTFWEFLRAFGPGYREEVLRAGDPLPFVYETRDWLKDLWHATR